MKNATSISLWLTQEYNFILTPWILTCLAGTWKYFVRKNGVHDGNMGNGDTWGGRELPLPLCVSLAPLFFLVPINTFRCLLRRLHRSETSLTLLDSLTWAMLRYASLNFSKTNTKLWWQGECLIPQQFFQTWSFVLMLFCDCFCLCFQ